MTIYDNLLRRSSRVVPVREGRVSVRPSGSGSYVDIGYCRIESDEPAAITVKNALGGRMVIGYSIRLEISLLQTSMSEIVAMPTIQAAAHDIKITRSLEDEGLVSEERLFTEFFIQLLPGLKDGKIKFIAEGQMSVLALAAHLTVTVLDEDFSEGVPAGWYGITAGTRHNIIPQTCGILQQRDGFSSWIECSPGDVYDISCLAEADTNIGSPTPEFSVGFAYDLTDGYNRTHWIGVDSTTEIDPPTQLSGQWQIPEGITHFSLWFQINSFDDFEPWHFTGVKLRRLA